MTVAQVNIRGEDPHADKVSSGLDESRGTIDCAHQLSVVVHDNGARN